MLPRVNVLMSTYNGEKYIVEQIESVLKQSYQNIHLYIRDDGSSDGTVRILKDYEKDSRITVVYGANEGYGRSFLELLRQADIGEYWAYCDQDDVWMRDKLKAAVEWLEGQNSDTPSMFHTAYYNTDEHLNIENTVQAPQYNVTFIRTITECVHMGFSSVMNATLRELVLKADINHIITHDWWTELVVMEFGQVCYCDKPMSYHRRLQSSVSGGALATRIRWLKKALKGNAEITTCTKEFMRVFGQDMKASDRKVLSWFVSDKYNFISALKKCFYIRRWRPSWSSEIVVRFLMLIGKI